MAAILLVDDRPENLVALEAILEPLGHELVTAGSGTEALRVDGYLSAVSKVSGDGVLGGVGAGVAAGVEALACLLPAQKLGFVPEMFLNRAGGLRASSFRHPRPWREFGLRCHRGRAASSDRAGSQRCQRRSTASC